MRGVCSPRAPLPQGACGLHGPLHDVEGKGSLCLVALLFFSLQFLKWIIYWKWFVTNKPPLYQGLGLYWPLTPTPLALRELLGQG